MSGKCPKLEAACIGDRMAGVGPEATRVFGRNAQIAAIPSRRNRMGQIGPSAPLAILSDITGTPALDAAHAK